MARWYDHALNKQHVERLRASLDDDGRVLVFLGAGLSFGAARQVGTSAAELLEARQPGEA